MRLDLYVKGEGDVVRFADTVCYTIGERVWVCRVFWVIGMVLSDEMKREGERDRG